MRISKVILSLIFLILPTLCPAHRLRAVSFEPAADILHGKLLRKDANGVEAAMIKVMLPIPGAEFDGNLIGDPEFHANEYWVWLEAGGDGTRMFDIHCPGAETLRVYFDEISDIVKPASRQVYTLRLDIPESVYGLAALRDTGLRGTVIDITYRPVGADVRLIRDGQTRASGKTPLMLSDIIEGTYAVIIEAPGYHTALLDATVKPGHPVSLTGTLTGDDVSPEVAAIIATPRQGTPQQRERYQTMIRRMNHDDPDSLLSAGDEMTRLTEERYPPALELAGLGAYYSQDYAKAVALYQAAAEGGEPEGMVSLGHCFYHGYGLRQDYREAFKWEEAAARLGNATGMYNIAEMYETGKGVRADFSRALEWYLRAAAAGLDLKSYPLSDKARDSLRRYGLAL